MKTEIKQLRRDLQAAILLGKPQAVDIALDGLLELPGVASNDQMSGGFIEKVVIPVGETLAGLKSAQLRHLLSHPLAVGRALGGVALAHRTINYGDANSQDLHPAGNDARLDVRLALGRALYRLSEVHPEATLPLGVAWISHTSSRLRYTALVFLPALAPKYQAETFRLLGTLGTESSQEVRAALVDACNHLAGMGFNGQVLDLLERWSSTPHPDAWLICRTLSASWAVNHAARVKAILQEVSLKTGESSHVAGARKALHRHGLDLDIPGKTPD